MHVPVLRKYNGGVRYYTVMNAGSDEELVRKVRTFADDALRAQGDTSDRTGTAPTSASSTPAPVPPTPPPAEKIAPGAAAQKPAAVAVRKHAAEKAISAELVKHVPHDTESHLSTHGAPLLDIRNEAKGERATTIVRDTRKKRWSLSRALGDSIRDWADDQREAIEGVITPTETRPNVPPAHSRTKVIEAARAKSTLAPQDDRHAVVEKLRTFAQDASRATGTPYTPATETPNTPPTKATKPVAPAPHGVADVAPQVRAQPTRAGTEVTPPQKTEVAQGAADVAPQVTRTYESLRTETPAPKPTKARNAAIERLLAARIRAAAPIVTPAPAPSRDIPFEPPTFAEKETAPVRTYRSDAIRDVEENQRSVPQIAAAEATRREVRPPVIPAPSARPYAIAGVLMILIIAVGGFGIFWYANRAPEEVGSIARIPTFIAIDALVPAQFSENRALFLENLSVAADTAGNGVTQVYPTNNPEGERVAVSTGEVMRVLDPRAPGAFLRSLEEEMMFGATGSGAPFFILKTTQFDTAFAGMLEWERALSADLAPIFGEPVGRSLDPSARTGDQARAAFFYDDTVANVDVRVLADERGEERILYAFFDQRTIVIAASRDALQTVFSRLR